MNENNELLEYIYQNSEMGKYTIEKMINELKYTIEKMINELKGKDNKIIKDAEDILKKYEIFYKDLKKQLKKENVKPKDSSLLSKMGASMGIKKEVISDNSDASIADMLIKGMSMGVLDIEKKLSQYDEIANKKSIKLAKDFLKFQQESITQLKKYL